MKLSFRHLVNAIFGLWLLQCSNTSLAFSLPPPEVFIPSTEVTEDAALDAQVQPVTSALGSHIRAIHRSFSRPGGVSQPAGGSAGADDGRSHGFWANSSNTDFENTFSRLAFEGTSQLLLLGIDFSLAENHILGLAVGSENSDIDTTFNSGSQKTDGTTIAPYYGWLISDNWSIDISMGISDLDMDQSRTEPLILVPAPGLIPVPPPVTSSVSGERDFTAINFNGFWTFGNWNLGSRVGYLSATSDQDAYTESDGTDVDSNSVDLKQTFIGGDVAYSFGASETFLSAVMQKDSTDEIVLEPFPGLEQPPDDDDSLLLSAGWRYYSQDGVSAILEWITRNGKEQYSEDSVALTFRVDFE
jgi:hypothetical protein